MTQSGRCEISEIREIRDTACNNSPVGNFNPYTRCIFLPRMLMNAYCYADRESRKIKKTGVAGFHSSFLKITSGLCFIQDLIRNLLQLKN